MYKIFLKYFKLFPINACPLKKKRVHLRTISPNFKLPWLFGYTPKLNPII